VVIYIPERSWTEVLRSGNPVDRGKKNRRCLWESGGNGG